MRFSAIFQPTTLFSLKDSNSTNSGAKSLFLPSPYAIKMAFLDRAISLGGENFAENDVKFAMLRDVDICYRIKGDFCVNNCFVKIQKQRDREPFKSTVSFREYLYLNEPLEIIFEVKNNDDVVFLKHYLYRINYFGKRGCFFQFMGYNDNPDEANVKEFNTKEGCAGLIQEFDDFDNTLTFEMVDSFNKLTKTKRKKVLFSLPLKNLRSSKSYTNYLVIE